MSYEQCERRGAWSPPVHPAIGSRGKGLAVARSESVTDGGDGDCGPNVVVLFVCVER
jgi:hypothetical protein